MKKYTIEELNNIMEETGGGLYLSGTGITELPDNLTVGGGLYLRGTGITELPENLTVGGGLYLRGTGITNPNNYKRLKNGDYKANRYIYADNILTHIKGCKTIKGYTYYQGKIKGQNVISDEKNYAHCKSFSEGVKELEFKAAQDRGQEQYRGISIDDEMPAEEMITMYRIITGACKQGTEQFISSLGKLKDKYTAREVIDITKGQYGAEIFKRFFAA